MRNDGQESPAPEGTEPSLPVGRVPPGQQLLDPGRRPLVGERDGPPRDAPWSLSVGGLVDVPFRLDRAALEALPRVEAVVDVHCVTRWSQLGRRYVGVLLETILPPARLDPAARFFSFRAATARDHDTSLPIADAYALGTLFAWECDGEPIPYEQGGPVRSIVPGKYFYKSLKWPAFLDVLADDRLGFWERTAGYHNGADPWREERFAAARLSKAEMRALAAGGVLDGLDLLGFDGRGIAHARFSARGALLRNSNFSHADLPAADFSGANLSNARFLGANLRGADFRGADLEGTDLSGADLRGANLGGASLFGATFVGRQPALCDRATRLPSAAREQVAPPQQHFLATLDVEWVE